VPFQEKDLAASMALQHDPKRSERLVARPREMIYNQGDLKGETAIQRLALKCISGKKGFI
jgi:hypothetical protein